VEKCDPRAVLEGDIGEREGGVEEAAENRQGCLRRYEALLAGSFVLPAVAWLVFAGAAVSSVGSPGQHEGTRLALGFASAALLGVVLWLSALARHTLTRILLGAIAACLMGVGLLATWGHLVEMHVVIWPLLAAIVALAIVGGWLGHQRWLTAVTAIGIALGIAAAMEPPRLTPPVTESAGGMTLTLSGLERGGSEVWIDLKRDPAFGSRMRPTSATGSFLGGLPVRVILLPGIPRGDEDTWSILSYPPPWVRSFDLQVAVERMPAQPAVSLELPLPEVGAQTMQRVRASSGDITVAVGPLAVHPGAAQGEVYVDLRLWAAGAYLGDSGAIWLTDAEGDPLEWETAFESVTGRTEFSTMVARIVLPEAPETMVVHVLAPRQLLHSQWTFRFEGVPNPPRETKVGKPARWRTESGAGSGGG